MGGPSVETLNPPQVILSRTAFLQRSVSKGDGLLPRFEIASGAVILRYTATRNVAALRLTRWGDQVETINPPQVILSRTAFLQRSVSKGDGLLPRLQPHPDYLFVIFLRFSLSRTTL